MKIGLVVGLIMVLMVSGADPSAACTCAPRTMPEFLENADVAFVGTVLAREHPDEGAAIQSSADPVYFTFLVEMAWKGVHTDTLRVRTAVGGSSCGTSFGEGLRYVVFAHGRDQEWATGLCSGNRLLETALDARYLLPEPELIQPGASWPDIAAEDLVAMLEDEDFKVRNQAARLLAIPWERTVPGQGLNELFLAFPEECGAVLLAPPDSAAVTATWKKLAYTALESPDHLTRRAGYRALGVLACGNELATVLQRGFSDPADGDAVSTTGFIMLQCHQELERSQVDDLIRRYIQVIRPSEGDAGWVLVSWLGSFSDQKDIILPYLDDLVATHPGGQLETRARQVRQKLQEPRQRE